ncbi:DUF29 family protein [Duganella vulcania]|uniref:DUF29 family protein n=1 Tax=Duganella vulcania TaxID=2692166 RepID=A0A845GSE9_9BURK|nr:DUF29 family protein [Duganella vulcania]
MGTQDTVFLLSGIKRGKRHRISLTTLEVRHAKYATECYPIARRRAAEETGLGEDVFPPGLLYSIEQLLDQDFMP